MSANGWMVLIRREFWEHRVLWMAPVVLAALYLALCLLPIGFNPGGIGMMEGTQAGSPNRGVMLFLSIQLLFTAVLFALMSVVVFFYLSDCLYSERKDRSILFWKSMPVSDAATVLSKLLVAMLIMPLGVYALATVTNLLAFAILFVRFRDAPYLGQFVYWDTGAWLHLNAVLIVDLLILALWYAPVAAYQLLVSAWAKSSVFVWTILPPLAVVFGERLAFGTWNVAALLAGRLGAGFPGVGRGVGPRILGPEGLFDRIDALGLLATANLWIGVAIAALLVFAAIRIRRYRDDS